MVAHIRAAPSQPEIAKSVRAGGVVPQEGIAESAEGMETTPIDSKFFQNQVQFAPQDVVLTQRLPFPRAEEVPSRPSGGDAEHYAAARTVAALRAASGGRNTIVP